MGLYERLMGIEPARLPVHSFQATLAEFARGRLTGPQAQAVIDSFSDPLTPVEVAEATTLVNTISGSTAAKLARAKEIDDVLLLSSQLAPGYDTPAAVKTRLGV